MEFSAVRYKLELARKKNIDRDFQAKLFFKNKKIFNNGNFNDIFRGEIQP